VGALSRAPRRRAQRRAERRRDRRGEDTLNALGVPRERHEQTFSPVERLHLFVDRLSGRLATQVDNNMLYFNACKEAIVLLEGSPNSGNFRTRQAIAKLRAITTPAGSPSSLILPS
jgi:hypothetical protein